MDSRISAQQPIDRFGPTVTTGKLPLSQFTTTITYLIFYQQSRPDRGNGNECILSPIGPDNLGRKFEILEKSCIRPERGSFWNKG